MHLKVHLAGFHLAAGLLAAGLALAPPSAFAQQHATEQDSAVKAQPDPHTPPASMPIDPKKAAENQKKPEPADKAKPKAGAATPPPRNRTMEFTLPPLVAIAEVPRGKAVMIQGQVLSPQATTFVLNDGNASMVVNLGPDWRALSKVRAGDRIGVIGQMDPYGSPLFRATGIVLDTGKIVVIPNS